jgi:amino acid adenylation domain-containing protein
MPEPECALFWRRAADLLAHLPSRNEASDARHFQQASLLLSASDRAALVSAAQGLPISLDDLFLSAFAAFLSRLSRVDIVPVADLREPVALRTFSPGEAATFAAIAEHQQSDDPDDPVLPGGRTIAFAFVPEDGTEPGVELCALALTVKETPAGLTATLSSNAAWPESVLQRWLRYFEVFVLAAARQPQAAIRVLPLLDDASCGEFYQRLNNTRNPFADADAAHRMFARWARNTPDAVAVVAESGQYTYRELDEQSSKLARLLAGMGAGAGKPIAICMERSAELPMAMLAVLKSGSCYVPLDPHDPPQRLTTILRECSPCALVANGPLPIPAEELPPAVRVDEPWPESAAGTDLPGADSESAAYVIYTSGTTGRPKGAVVPHRALTNVLCGSRQTLRFHPGDRLLAVSTISFDVATLDMLLPLISGGSVVVSPAKAATDPVRIGEMLDHYGVTVLQLTPISWGMLADSGWAGKADLRMVSGGEVLPPKLADRLLRAGAELWNSYGPTETGIACAMMPVTPGMAGIPLGSPMANVRLYVADENQRPLPPDVPGELCIAGEGVGAGYFNRPELTREFFVPDLLDPGRSMYRSRDLARVTSANRVEFLGRLDFQIKLRGYRIEIEEIESVLREHPGVSQAVVQLREDPLGDPALVAWVTLQNQDLNPDDLQRHAAQFLPEYMLPRRLMILGDMPLTPAGKIDRRQLPSPQWNSPVSLAVAPEDELERKLLAIFRDVLGNRRMGVTDNFFDYGGYSLLVVRLFSRIKRELNLNLPISMVFDAPSVRALADYVRRGTLPSVIVPIRRTGRRAPLLVIHSYLIYHALARAAGEDRPVYGVREPGARDRSLTIAQRADRYAEAILKLFPAGPVYLAGWCAAASLTIEVARRLDAEYGQTGIVFLFDAERPGFLNQQAAETSFGTKLEASWKFHWPRFLAAPFLQKPAYVGRVFRHRYETMVDRFASRHRHAAQWLQRRFPTALPEVLVNNDSLSSIIIRQSDWKPYSGRIVLLRASEEPVYAGADPSLGWREIALEGVEVVFVSGDHESMFQDPHLADLGQKLRYALDAADASWPTGSVGESRFAG